MFLPITHDRYLVTELAMVPAILKSSGRVLNCSSLLKVSVRLLAASAGRRFK